MNNTSSMLELSNEIDPLNFIRLLFLSNRTIESIIFINKNNEDYNNTISKIVKMSENLKFRFGKLSTEIYLNDAIKNKSVMALNYVNNINVNETYYLKCIIKIQNINCINNIFHTESKILNNNENFDFVSYQNKFINALNEINTTYGTNYYFTFKFYKLRANKEIIETFPIIKQSGEIEYVQSNEIPTDRSNSLDKINSKKRRLIDIDVESDSDSDSD